jgi:hypothetical protein
VTKAEAKRRVLASVATMIDPRSGGQNEYLSYGRDGDELPTRDRNRMLAAAVELADELLRRSQQKAVPR